MNWLAKLDAAINVVCPIDGVSIGLKDDKSTWRIDFRPEATPEQRAAAQAVVDGFDKNSATTYRDKRKAAYIAELGTVPDFIETVGDVLDVLIREVRSRGASVTPEFSALAGKIDAIKARFPK